MRANPNLGSPGADMTEVGEVVVGECWVLDGEPRVQVCCSVGGSATLARLSAARSRFPHNAKLPAFAEEWTYGEFLGELAEPG
jgi:hypothetical protein